MSRPPFFQFFPKDWITKTVGLSLEQEGAYIRLLVAARTTSDDWCSLPDDDTVLARIVGVGRRKWLTLRTSLVGIHFHNVGGRLVHPRLLEEAEIQRERRVQATDAGKESWRKRSNDRSSDRSATAERPFEQRTNLASAVAFATENLESKAGATPRQPERPAQEKVNGTAQPRNTKPDLAMIADKAKHLGAAKVSEIIGIAWGWNKLGVCYPPLVTRLVEIYVERSGKIANPHAYFNAQSDQFRDMHAQVMGRIREAEGEAFKKADTKAAARIVEQANRLHEVRAEVEGDTP